MMGLRLLLLLFPAPRGVGRPDGAPPGTLRAGQRVRENRRRVKGAVHLEREGVAGGAFPPRARPRDQGTPREGDGREEEAARQPAARGGAGRGPRRRGRRPAVFLLPYMTKGAARPAGAWTAAEPSSDGGRL